VNAGEAIGRCKQLYRAGTPNIWGLNFILILARGANSKPVYPWGVNSKLSIYFHQPSLYN
jgi:hypothetical protein